MKRTIRVLVADDSALMRRVLKEILEAEPGIEVADTARDGEVLLEKARDLKPDVITLDINMPRMNGITALGILMQEHIAPVVMVSSLTQAGAAITLQALEMGAFDCIAKPGGTMTADMRSVRQALISRVKAAAHTGILQRLTRQDGRAAGKDTGRSSTSRQRQTENLATPVVRKSSDIRNPRSRAVAIGISTGGPKTILEVLPKLPADFPAAIFMVQHLPAHFTASFAERLNSSCPMRCVEAQSGMVVTPGTIYLGQGGRHLNVVRKTSGEVIIRTPQRPEHLFMPSVDVMMNSVLEVYGANTLGVLMTGMGDDGAEAMRSITLAGGHTVAESAESAVVWGMPGAAVACGGANVVMPSWEIASEIMKSVA